MINYVLDAFAWIEYLDGTEKGKVVKKILKENKGNIYTSAITISEVISKAKRKDKDTDLAFKFMIYNSKVVGITHVHARDVGLIHAEMKKKIKTFGMADAFVITAAKKLDAKIVTGDPHFKGIKGTILL